MTTGEFSVVQFFVNGSYEYVRKHVDPKEAMDAFIHYCTSVASKSGLVREVIIKDGGDHTNYHWKHGEGIVFPEEYKGELK